MPQENFSGRKKGEMARWWKKFPVGGILGWFGVRGDPVCVACTLAGRKTVT